MNATEKGSDMTRETFIKACDLAEQYGDNITLGGGEPTLHPLFFDFIGIALSYANVCDEMIPFIITNGKETDIALKLAQLAKRGVVSAELSQDEYHESIDHIVIEAFTSKQRFGFDRENNNDFRGIRSVKRILSRGRGKQVPNAKDECACEDMFITPQGKIYACGCKKEYLGTLDNKNIPEEYYERESKCSQMNKTIKEQLEDTGS